jgi:predicted RNA-binding protein YlqC (UPF0109 family)
MVEEDLLHELVVGLVHKPDYVEITQFAGPKGDKNLVIHCASEDRGRIIGKAGCNIEALRAYFRSYATFDGGRRLYVHLEKLDD